MWPLNRKDEAQCICKLSPLGLLPCSHTVWLEGTIQASRSDSWRCRQEGAQSHHAKNQAPQYLRNAAGILRRGDAYLNPLVGWPRMSGSRTSGTSKLSPGVQVPALFSLIFVGKNRSSENVWANAWKFRKPGNHPNFEKKSSRSEKAILGATLGIRGVLGATLGMALTT